MISLPKPLRSREAGSVLALFAILLFGLVALLALSIDTGFVLLARRQMQAAVNSASVEGLRWRDRLPPVDDLVAIGEDPSNPAELETRKDEIRRKMARQFVHASFDVDYDVGSPDPSTAVLGAGPMIGFEGGIDIGGGLRASSLIRQQNPRAYKPALALNLGNSVSGDMVSGGYLVDGSRDDYEDFLDVNDPPDAFLVRLRRTDEDLSSAPDASTSGPPIPSLFGRAAIARAEEGNPQALLQRRATGVRVRATSIADLKPAVSVGYSSNTDRPGVRYFVDRSVFDCSNPTILIDELEVPLDPLGPPVLPCPSGAGGAVVLGDSVASLVPAAPPLPSESFVVAIYDSSVCPAAAADVVVGFANVRIIDQSVVPAGDLVLANGSSTFVRNCQLSADCFDSLITNCFQLQGAAVRAPARVRATR